MAKGVEETMEQAPFFPEAQLLDISTPILRTTKQEVSFKTYNQTSGF